MRKFIVSLVAVSVLAMSSSGCYRRPYYRSGVVVREHEPIVRDRVIVR
jgi:hypothetical protein